MSARMQEMFAELNRKYWSGRLRSCKVRFVTFRISGQCGEYRSETKTILIRRGLSEQELIGTLLHEMCHIGCPRHAAKFRAKLTRLRKIGAPLASADLGALDTPYRPPRFEIQECIESLVTEEGPASWRDARRLLARDLDSPQVRLDRSRWVRCYWERLRTDFLAARDLRAAHAASPT